MLSCMILDDEQHAVDLLSQHVKQTSFLKLVHAITNPVEAVGIIKKGKIDLVFIDIEMPELTGLDVIKATMGKTNFIICSAFPQYAMQGFEHDVVDYLLKPVTYPRFIKAASKAMNMMTQQAPVAEQINHDFIFIKTEFRGKLVRLNYSDIYYIEGMKNYVAFHTPHGKKMALMNLKFLEESLPPGRFVRIHNSYIVPVNTITQIEGNEVELRTASVRLPVGITYKESLMEKLKIR